MSFVYKTMKSPIGLLTLVASDKGLAGILWEHDNPERVRLTPRTEDTGNPVLLETEKQLNEYFAGKRRSFSVTLDYVGTPFQKKVWKSMLASRSARREAMVSLPKKSEIQKRCVRWALQTAKIRSPLSVLAIG